MAYGYTDLTDAQIIELNELIRQCGPVAIVSRVVAICETDADEITAEGSIIDQATRGRFLRESVQMLKDVLPRLEELE